MIARTAPAVAASARFPDGKKRPAAAVFPSMSRLASAALLCSSLVALWPATAVTGTTPPALPDLVQTDPRGGFARGGKSYCAPVAVSNSLMGLFGSRLQANGKSQFDLVNQLASEDYMATDPVDGTGPSGVLRGVQRFLRDLGEKARGPRLVYQGWRPHPAEFSSGKRVPEPAAIAAALASGGAAWVNLGWYRKLPQPGSYERTGGHWVTVVDAGRDAAGKPDTERIAIHDPAPRAGTKPWLQSIVMTPLAAGTLTGKSANLPQPAAGYRVMGGDMRLRKGADLAIIDGVVTLSFEQPAGPRPLSSSAKSR